MQNASMHEWERVASKASQFLQCGTISGSAAKEQESKEYQVKRGALAHGDRASNESCRP
jgi:hypothetical protein